MTEEQAKRGPTAAWLVPHSQAEYRDERALVDWLVGSLAVEGVYRVVHIRPWERVKVGDTLLFHKSLWIVGYGSVAQAVQYEPSRWVAPNGKAFGYEGVVRVDPRSVQIFETPIPFAEAKEAIGRGLTFRSLQRLDAEERAAILALRTDG